MTKWLPVSLATLSLVACSCAPRPSTAPAPTTKPPAAIQAPAATNKPAVSAPAAKRETKPTPAVSAPTARPASTQTVTAAAVTNAAAKKDVPTIPGAIRIRGAIADIKLDGADRSVTLTPNAVNGKTGDPVVFTISPHIIFKGVGKIEDLKIGDLLRLDYLEADGKKTAVEIRH